MHGTDRCHHDIAGGDANRLPRGVKLAITGGYVLARVDYEAPEARAFMQRYAVQAFPTLLVLAADGSLVRRLTISFDPATMAATLRG